MCFEVGPLLVINGVGVRVGVLYTLYGGSCESEGFVDYLHKICVWKYGLRSYVSESVFSY